LRTLDNEEEISKYLREHPSPPETFGKVDYSDGTTQELFRRDLTNKVIHSKGLEWDFSVLDRPMVVCIAADDQAKRGWTKAAVYVIALMTLCGRLMS
jgi:hypothetical protein